MFVPHLPFSACWTLWPTFSPAAHEASWTWLPSCSFSLPHPSIYGVPWLGGEAEWERWKASNKVKGREESWHLLASSHSVGLINPKPLDSCQPYTFQLPSMPAFEINEDPGWIPNTGNRALLQKQGVEEKNEGLELAALAKTASWGTDDDLRIKENS